MIHQVEGADIIRLLKLVLLGEPKQSDFGSVYG